MVKNIQVLKFNLNIKYSVHSDTPFLACFEMFFGSCLPSSLKEQEIFGCDLVQFLGQMSWQQKCTGLQ